MEKYHYREYKGENGMNLKDAGICDLVNILKSKEQQGPTTPAVYTISP
jgi:hypothetical protein